MLDPVPTNVTSKEYLSATRLGRGAQRDIPGPSLVSAGVEFLWTYDLRPGDYVVMDLSRGGSGYRQYSGAGAFLVSLT